MKFSDIFSKERKVAPKHSVPDDLPPPPAPAPATSLAGVSAMPVISVTEPFQGSSVRTDWERILSPQRQAARQVYGKAISTMDRVLDGLAERPRPVSDDLSMTVNSIVEQLSAGNQALLGLATCSTPKNYLLAHAVNSAIYSIWLGIGLGWEVEELAALGLGALTQDIGMVSFMDLALLPRALTGLDRDKVRTHPLESQRLLAHLEDLDSARRQFLSEAIEQEYEWKSGRITPISDNKSANVGTISRVLGLCDIYEAMTHPRSWRRGEVPHEMIKKFLKQPAREYEPSIIRAFVGQLSLFPPGSWVQLSTQESGYVVAVKASMPTRPIVEIRVNAEGMALYPSRFVDLSENPTTHIISTKDEARSEIKDQELLKELEAARSWIA